MNDIVFGTDGFRGLIGEKFNFENVRRIAQGLADYIAYKSMKGEDKKVVIGYDRRFLSEEFAKQFAMVLEKSEIKCHLSLTPIPTPCVSMLTDKEYILGVVITASHNPYLYNGVKIKYQARSIPPLMSAEIENRIPKNSVSVQGNINIETKDFRNNYIKYLTSKYNISRILSSIKGKIVIDFMNGASAELYQDLFSKHKNIICLHTLRDPLFSEVGSPEPVEKHLSSLIKTVKDNKALMGIAIDGDGDRFALIDNNGQYLSPCQIAPILLDYLINDKKLSGKIVQAVSMGYITKRIAKEKNFLFEEVPVGFKYIAEKMISEDVLFGVEESGGYTWKGNIPERDGLVTAFAFMEIIARRKKNISEILSQLEKRYGKSYFIRKDYPINKAVTNKHSFAVKIKKKLPKLILNQKVKEISTLDGLKVILENDWWFLVRPSGTEPLLRIYGETESKNNTEKILDLAYKLSNEENKEAK
jgi:phosphomannomutase